MVLSNRLVIRERIHKLSVMWSVSSTLYFVVAGRVMVPVAFSRRGLSLGFSSVFLKSSVRQLSDGLRARFGEGIPIWRREYF